MLPTSYRRTSATCSQTPKRLPACGASRRCRSKLCSRRRRRTIERHSLFQRRRSSTGNRRSSCHQSNGNTKKILRRARRAKRRSSNPKGLQERLSRLRRQRRLLKVVPSGRKLNRHRRSPQWYHNRSRKASLPLRHSMRRLMKLRIKTLSQWSAITLMALPRRSQSP